MLQSKDFLTTQMNPKCPECLQTLIRTLPTTFQSPSTFKLHLQLSKPPKTPYSQKNPKTTHFKLQLIGSFFSGPLAVKGIIERGSKSGQVSFEPLLVAQDGVEGDLQLVEATTIVAKSCLRSLPGSLSLWV